MITDGDSNTVRLPSLNYPPPGEDWNTRCCLGGDSAAQQSGFSNCNWDPSSGPDLSCNCTNTNILGDASKRIPMGCHAEITKERTALLGVVPGILTYAVGVGAANIATINKISGDPSRSYSVLDFQQLLAQIDQITQNFCPTPDPVHECGTCCGKCICGTCTTPDFPINPPPCSTNSLQYNPNVSLCYNLVPGNVPCAALPCKVPSCADNFNPCTQTYNKVCTYVDVVCSGGDDCYDYTCVVQGGSGSCVKSACKPNPGCPCTPAPTKSPTRSPTRAPTESPTERPTRAPTERPSEAPTERPTAEPTTAPTERPTEAPTRAPTAPTAIPVIPTERPTEAPTRAPTEQPTKAPTKAPTKIPTRAPTRAPTEEPTGAPSNQPTFAPTGAPTSPPIPPCFHSGALCGVGHCCNSSDGPNFPDNETCCCENGYQGVLCAIPPGERECTQNNDCVASNLCTVATCDLVTFKCVFSNYTCPSDNDACTADVCDNERGCLYNDLSILCDDHLECTTDSCDRITGECSNVQRNCSHLADVCHTVLCDNYQSNVSLQCVPQSVLCRVDNNCTSAECYLNYTDPRTNQNRSGCRNTTFDCNFVYFGVVAGLVAGAIVGIVIAAAIVLCGAMAGGGAYAISQTSSSDHHNKVKVNPLYRPHGKSSAGINVD
jgi:hypothetical protein